MIKRKLSLCGAVVGVLLFALAAEATPPRITNGLVGEWHLNGNAADTSGLGHNGTLVGSSSGVYAYGFLGTSMQGTAANLVGAKYFSVPNSASLNFGTGSFTLAAWIRMSSPSSNSIKTIIDNRGTDGRGFAFTVYQGNRLLLQLADSSGWQNYFSDASYTLSPNRWHHVAVVVNRTSWPINLQFWIDGWRAGSATPILGNVNNMNNPFYIGRHKDWSTSNFNDRLDEVLVYNRALDTLDSISLSYPGRPYFEPTFWNSSSRRPYNNCYNYASDKATNSFAQPGRAAGAQAASMSCSAVLAAAIADGLQPVPDYPNTAFTYKGAVALVVAPGFDYHFYRLDESGYWTHKPGQTSATDRDNSGQLITDPRTANRGVYTNFCGFFLVWSDNNQGWGHENIQ